MPETLEELIKIMKEGGVLESERLEEAIRSMDRRYFVSNGLLESVYADYPLPIGHGQTISQPSTVVLMTQALDVKKGQKVLEVGAGSGWQAALLGYLVGSEGKVYTIEINQWLKEFAENNIEKMGQKNVRIIEGDGSKGYEKEAPYDRIMVTAAAREVPKPLKKQLKTKGKMVIPLGGSFSQQVMALRKEKGRLRILEKLGHFRFVKLKGEYGFRG